MANMVLGSPEPVRFGGKLINDMRKKLVESEREGEQDQFKRLRLWALYVGTLAEKVPITGSDSLGWFETNYQTLAAGMGLSGWEDAKRVMRQFLFSDHLHQEIHTGRLHRISDVRQGLYAASGSSWREPILEAGLIGGTQNEATGSVGIGKQRALDE